jgi:multimeric flavodoxin WrbA
VKLFADVFYVLDRVMYYPRLPQFYHHRYALGVAITKLKSRGKEKMGLATNTLAAVKRNIAKMQVNIQSTVEKENAGDLEIGGKWKKRHSADRDLAAAGLSLSPRKHRKLY